LGTGLGGIHGMHRYMWHPKGPLVQTVGTETIHSDPPPLKKKARLKMVLKGDGVSQGPHLEYNFYKNPAMISS
jgi:hypothetical protein